MANQFEANKQAGPAGIIPTGLINSGSIAGRDWGAGFVLSSVLAEVTAVSSNPGVANTFRTIYSASGKGALSFLAVGNADATSRTHSVRVTIDGNRVFDITTPHTTTNYATAILGLIFYLGAANQWGAITEPLLFEKSLLIEHAATVDGNAKLAYRVIPR